MAFVLADRVSETTATAGTGAISLAGAAAGFRAFSAVMATGDTTRYTVVDDATGAWEVSVGTFTAGTPPTLSRGPVASSAAGNAAVAFAGNAATRVFMTADAGYFATFAPKAAPVLTGTVIIDGPNDIMLAGAGLGASPTIQAAGGDTNITLTLSGKGTGPVRIPILDAEGGTIDGTAIGATVPAAGRFSAITSGTNTATGFVTLTLNGVAAAQRSVDYQTGGLIRWQFGVTGGTEGGSNAGSDFFVDAFNDAGTYIATGIRIARATARVTMSAGAVITGGSLDNAPVGATTANTGRFTTLTHTGFLLRSMATGLTASTTNTQAGALGLTASVNNITTAAASSAVRLPAVALATGTAAEIIVRNGGANAVNVYPPTSAAINALAANAAFSLAAGASARFLQLSTTLFVTA